MQQKKVNGRPNDERTILGLRFFLGTAQQAVTRSEAGGLVLIPAAPALKNLGVNQVYRDALLSADVLLTDSAFMVMVWNMLEKDNITRLSGLTYLRELIRLPSFQVPGNTLWILPMADSVAKTSGWLAATGITVPATHFYVAPTYDVVAGDVVDPHLLALIEQLRPQHIVVGVGGGTQEPLGADLKRRLSYRPSIHCVGAAIGFLTGEQAAIPVLADRFYLGWLIRTIHDPVRFSRRYWEARKLYSLLHRYRDRLPGSQPLTPRTLSHTVVAEDSRR